MLRVLLISGEYHPMEGGVADFTHLIGRAMAGQGAEVHVLTSDKAVSEADEGLVHVHPLMPSWNWAPLLASVRCLLAGLEPHVVNIQYQTAAYGMHPAINLLPRLSGRVPFVVTFHDLRAPYLFPKAGPIRRWVNLALARACEAVIVTNAQDRAHLETSRGVSRLEVIPIGSNIPCAPPPGYDRARWRHSHGIPEDSLLLCYFGFLNATKGGEELVDALSRLCQVRNDVRLLMVGGTMGASDPTNKTYLDLVRWAIRERGLTQRVMWTGHVPPEEVSASFCSADVCVLPYRDGASFRRGSFMAALAHAMPIVSTYPEVALRELVHGDNVWLVPPRDPQALAVGIVHLADDATLRHRLSAGARALSLRFGWDQIASRTLELYRDVAGL